MRLPDLRRALRAIVLAGLPATAPGLSGCVGDECPSVHYRTFTFVLPVDPPLQLRVESCRADAEACDALCEMLFERSDFPHQATACKAIFRGPEVTAIGAYETWGDGCPVPGRRPAGLAPLLAPAARDRAGAWLARAATFEAASVHAFVHLARELEDHGAPAALVQWALRSAADEVRHTTMMAGLALRHGARPRKPEVAPPVRRSLAAMAHENAIEGCVHETWSAALAAWQAHTARDRDVRAIFAAIAADEVRHAALAWAIDRWVAPQLDLATRARILAARDSAAHALLDDLPRDPDDALAALGLPDLADGRALLARAHHTLWTGGPS